jgi:uncharacterized protein
MAFSILSLDGGGTWALIQVRVLQARYGAEAEGHTILQQFDMVIANSGGSMVLAALCANFKLSKIRQIFEDENILETIFDKKRGFKPGILGFERFSAKQKVKGLKAVLGPVAEMQLKDLPAFVNKPALQIIICGFDYDRERATYFRSNSLSRMEGRNIEDLVNRVEPSGRGHTSVTLLNAIHASSNAPLVFFDDPARIQYVGKSEDRLFWDGAVGGNNNPVVSGLLEAMTNGEAIGTIRIVSIGTANTVCPVIYGEKGEPAYDYKWLIKESEIATDLTEVKKMANAIIADPPDAATFNVHQIMGLDYTDRLPRLIRINPMIKPILNLANNTWTMPGINWTEKQMKHLFEMDMAITETTDIALINDMVDDYFAGHFENQGIRTGGKEMVPILGHKTFKDALDDWNSWDVTAGQIVANVEGEGAN